MKPKTINMVETELIASEHVKNALPKALIDYLWSLVFSEAATKNVVQIFKLLVSQLSERDVQDILHFTEDSEFLSNHRVFGFMPVNDEIHVICTEKGYHMILAKEKIYKRNCYMNLQDSSCPIRAC
ncbi:MAG: DUF960 family protein [Anaerotignum sp.]|nr:DUF960 family protein [Anaerotignum sp.]